MVALILWWAITIYVWVLIARCILSFVPLMVPGWTPRGFMLVLVEAIYTVTDPPIKLLGKVIPPIRLGTVMLDLSVILLFIALQFLRNFVWLIPF